MVTGLGTVEIAHALGTGRSGHAGCSLFPHLISAVHIRSIYPKQGISETHIMFDILKFDAHVQLACVRNHNLWVAKVETRVTPSMRSAARAIHLPAISSRDQLLGTALVSALATSMSVARYRLLVNVARENGANKPRLLVRTEAGFVNRLTDGGNAAPDVSRLFISRELKTALRQRVLDSYELHIEKIDQEHPDYKAMLFYGFRSVVQPELNGLPMIYKPDAVTERDKSSDRLQPLTPDLIAAEETR